MKEILQEYMPAVIVVIVFFLLVAIMQSDSVKGVVQNAFSSLITNSLNADAYKPTP